MCISLSLFSFGVMFNMISKLSLSTFACLQYYDLLNIFELNGFPSEDNPYLFNGDFVDRGSFSLEVILTLFAFKCMSPSGITFPNIVIVFNFIA